MLTQDLLNEIFTYNRDTGTLERKVPSHFSRPRESSTYLSVAINGKKHQVHRIIWLMLYGHIPKGMVIDHVNGNRGDNRMCNLRLASNTQNSRNGIISTNNTTGYKGVVSHGEKYRAVIQVNRISKHIGCYSSSEEAAYAYDAAALHYFGEFARTNAMMGLLPNTYANV